MKGGRNESKPLSPEMTVQEILGRHPGARRIFEAHGMGGCGGGSGPPEPLFLFARAHGVDPEQLLREIEALPETAGDPSPPTVEESPLFQTYIRGAILLALLWGGVWGVINLLRIAHASSFTALNLVSAQGHAHIQIFGWVGLFIMGVAFHVVPRFMNTVLPHPRAAAGAFWLMAAGVVLRVLGQVFFSRIPLAGGVLIASGAMELAAIVLFAGVIVQTVRKGGGKIETYLWFLSAGLLSFVVAGVIGLIGTVEMARWATPFFPFSWLGVLRHLQLYGFITCFILGVSLRAFPFLLGLRSPWEGMAKWAFVVYGGGVILQIVALSLDRSLLAFLAALLELSGGALFVYALRIFEPPEIVFPEAHVDRGIFWFVRAAWIWFLISLGMLVMIRLEAWRALSPWGHALIGAHPFWDATTHAMALGFITMMILGVGFRVIPIFSGRHALTGWGVKLSFLLLCSGVVLRVFVQPFVSVAPTPRIFALMGASGLLAYGAMAIFGVVIWRAMSNAPSLEAQEGIPDRITPKTSMRTIVTAWPQGREALLELGFERLRNVQDVGRMPRFVTLEMACRIHGIDPVETAERLTRRLCVEGGGEEASPRPTEPEAQR